MWRDSEHRDYWSHRHLTDVMCGLVQVPFLNADAYGISKNPLFRAPGG